MYRFFRNRLGRFLLSLAILCQMNAAGRADTGTVNRLLRHTYTILNPDSAIILFDSAFRLSKSINYADGAFLALITKGIKYFEKQDYENYRRVSYEAIPWAEKSTASDNVAWALINIGEAWFSEGDYITANKFYYRGLEDMSTRTSAITHTTANIYNSLGLVNMRLNQYTKALDYYNLAENASKQANLSYQLAISYDNKAAWYLQMHQPDSAERYSRLEMEVGHKMGKVDLRAFAWAKMGRVYVMKGRYKEALAALDTAVALARNRFQPPVVDAAYSLGEAFTRLGRYRDAEAILLWAYGQTRQHNYRDYYVTGYSSLVSLYRSMGKYQLALSYMDTLANVKDSLTSTDKARAINHLEIKYQTAEKDRKIAEKQLVIEQQGNKLIRKNILIISAVSGMLLLAVIFVIAYRNTRHRQRLAEELVRTLEQEKEIIKLNAKVEGEEKERTRIARDLHDGIGGMISAVMMRFSTLPRTVPAVTSEPAYRGAMDLLGEIGDEVRKTAHNLMPEILRKQALDEAVKALCNSIQAEGSLRVDCQCYGDFSHLGEEVKLNIYRIVQELLKNVLAHARAGKVLVQLVKHDETLAVTIEDNGIGFDTTSSGGGMGLENVRARVNTLGGYISIESAAGKGTTAYIEFDQGKKTSTNLKTTPL